MWHADPELTFQVAREEQERQIEDHVRRQYARKQKRGGVVPTVLGQVGDLLVGAGERLRRRAQMSTPIVTGGF